MIIHVKRMEDFCLISHDDKFHWVIQVCYGWIKQLVGREMEVNEVASFELPIPLREIREDL